MSYRLSSILGVAGIPHALTFAVLQGALGTAWSLPAAVIPILALDRLGGAFEVSVFFFAVSFVGLAAAMIVPLVIERVGRRTVFLVGGLLVALGGVVFPLAGLAGLVAGMVGYVVGFFCLDMGFSIAFMERIPRKAFTRFEPVRMMFMGAGFIIGPTLGVQLNLEIAAWAPFALMAVVALIAVIYTLNQRLVDPLTEQAASRRPSNPFRFVPRYGRQPRLRLAWLLAFIRSAWWTMFFIYAPIYCVEYGLGESWAGYILSASAFFMLLVPLWGLLGRRIGLRTLLGVGYLGTGLLTLAVAAAAGWPNVGVALLLGGTFVAALVDAAGNTLFLRAVHPHERPEMTAVFSTYRETAKIGPPGLCALLLIVFPLPAVFVAAGTFAVIGAWFTRFIPRRY